MFENGRTGATKFLVSTKEKTRMTTQLSPADRLVILDLAKNLLDGNQAAYPLPADRLVGTNTIVSSFGHGLHVHVTADSLTPDQKIYLREKLQLLADLSLQTGMNLTNEKLEDVVQRVQWALQYGQIGD
jgi:hypothetical protein